MSHLLLAIIARIIQISDLFKLSHRILLFVMKKTDSQQIGWNYCQENTIEPFHEIMALFVLRKLILQTRMHSHPVGLDVWFLVGPIVDFHTSCVRTAKVLVSLRGCPGSPEPSLVTYVISTITSWAGSIYRNCLCHFRLLFSSLLSESTTIVIFLLIYICYSV